MDLSGKSVLVNYRIYNIGVARRRHRTFSFQPHQIALLAIAVSLGSNSTGDNELIGTKLVGEGADKIKLSEGRFVNHRIYKG